MMKIQLTIVPALLILVALSSNLTILVEAQAGTIDCYDSCSTGCVKPDNDPMRKKMRQTVPPSGIRARETGA
ncbi:unnamed protein product [Thlaspi arvense]|uniref:Uncharacterized protein n=1 Tax=Thlaspi arvense TaxID=13288 RepID=A0AAU9R8K1_THLAR|nr:unnamed protein product [Thlaspi arvense]